jgi:hypothetical protein
MRGGVATADVVAMINAWRCLFAVKQAFWAFSSRAFSLAISSIDVSTVTRSLHLKKITLALMLVIHDLYRCVVRIR